MRELFLRLFSCEAMLKPHQRTEHQPPSTKEIYRHTIEMAWPSAVESVMVSLVGLIDTIMVSSLGHGAIAAVGITTQPRFLFLCMIFSLNIGITAVIARKRGEGNQEESCSVLKQAIMLSTLISLVSTVISVAFSEQLMLFAGAGEDILSDASIYYRVIMLGMILNSLLLTINAAQRGVGNTKIAMQTNLIANGVNVVFNYLLIGGNFGFPKLGVMGAALATVIGFLVGFLVSLWSILHRDSFLSLWYPVRWWFTKDALRSIWFVGSSALVEQLCLRFGFFFYSKIVASLGTVAFATHQICNNILNISFAVGDGLSVAASSLVGQSLGAKRPDMAIIYGKVGQRISFILSLGLFVVFITMRRVIMQAFTTEQEIIVSGMTIIIIIAFICLMQTTQVVMMGCLRGAGDTKFAAYVSLLSIALVRPASAFILCYPLGLGLVGAWLSLVFDQCIRMILSMVRFSGGKWTKLKL